MAKKNIVLGSGMAYIVEFDGTVPANEVFETEENRLGDIQGGASVEYKQTLYTAKDDLGLVSKEIITDEEALLKLGVLTFNAETIAKLTSTSEVKEATAEGVTKVTMKIGGVGRANGKKYAVRFVHKDGVIGVIRVTVVGANQAGFTLSFLKDKETVLNPEFKATPIDGEGTLILYEEERPAPAEITK